MVVLHHNLMPRALAVHPVNKRAIHKSSSHDVMYARQLTFALHLSGFLFLACVLGPKGNARLASRETIAPGFIKSDVWHARL